MGPQTHKAEDLSKRLLCQSGWNNMATWSYISHSFAPPKPSAPSSSMFPQHRLLWTAVSQRSCHEILSFYHGRDLLSNLSKPYVWQSNSDNPIQLTRNPMSSLCSALISLEWTNQPLLLHKLPGDYAGSWVHPFFTSHNPAKHGSLVEKKTQSNTPPFNETQRFQCAHPQRGQSKLA